MGNFVCKFAITRNNEYEKTICLWKEGCSCSPPGIGDVNQIGVIFKLFISLGDKNLKVYYNGCSSAWRNNLMNYIEDRLCLGNLKIFNGWSKINLVLSLTKATSDCSRKPLKYKGGSTGYQCSPTPHVNQCTRRHSKWKMSQNEEGGHVRRHDYIEGRRSKCLKWKGRCQGVVRSEVF